jgi:hypothetical protein
MQPHAVTTLLCGFSLSACVLVILVIHLVACLVTTGTAFADFVLHMPAFTSSLTGGLQFCYIGLSIIGIPIITAAIYGTMKRCEAPIRLYLGYLAICFVIDTVFLVDAIIQRETCTEHSSGFAGVWTAMSADMGEAFMCGVFRVVSYVLVALAVCGELYSLFIVWSLCTDVHESAHGLGLMQLPGSKHEFVAAVEQMQLRNAGLDLAINSVAHAKMLGAYPSVKSYGAVEAPGLSGNTIFGGTAFKIGEAFDHEAARW